MRKPTDRDAIVADCKKAAGIEIQRPLTPKAWQRQQNLIAGRVWSAMIDGFMPSQIDL